MPRLTTDIATAAKALCSGQVVAFPTETVYGLGACATNEDAIKAVFSLKGRPQDHPLIVHVATVASFANWADPVPEAVAKLAAEFMPGPLTLLLNRKSGVGELAAGGHPTIALRIPASKLALALIDSSGGALVAPSANRFGRPSATEAAHVAAEFAPSDLLILDGGPTTIGIESTILDLSDPARAQIARPGAITQAMLQATLQTDVAATAKTAAAGNLPAHYRPVQPVIVLADAAWDNCVRQHPDEKIAALGFTEPAGIAPKRWRKLAGEPNQAAHDFYRLLRELEATDASLIVIQKLPDDPLWVALANRISRASG